MPNSVLDVINGDSKAPEQTQQFMAASNPSAVENAQNTQTPDQLNSPPADKNPTELEQKPAADTMEKVAESAGFSMEGLSTAWHESGELPAEAYEKFAEMGLPREMIDQVCNSVVVADQQRVDTFKGDVAQSVGGMDQLNNLVEFMKSPEFDAGKRVDLEKMITLDNPTQSKMAMQEVQKMYEAAHGTSGNLITGGKGGAGGGDVFTSRKEQSAEIMKAEKSGDPVLKKAVMEKTLRTSRYNRANKINFQ